MKRIADGIARILAWRDRVAGNRALGEALYLWSMAAGVALYVFMINSSLSLMDGTAAILKLLKYAQLLSFAGLGVRLILFCDYDRRSFWITLLFGALSAFNFLITDDMTMLRGFLLVAGARGIDFRRIAKWFLYTLVASALVIFALADGGILLNYSFRRAENEPLRYALGFGHPNTLGLYTMLIVMLWSYCHFEKLTWKHLAALAAILFVLDMVADSRTSSALIVLLALLLAAAKRWGPRFAKNKAYWALMALIPLIVFAASLYFSAAPVHSNGLTDLVDKATSYRFSIINRYVGDYPPTVWGRKLIESTDPNSSGSSIDNAAALLLLRYGLVQLVVFWGLLTAVMVRTLRHGDVALSILVALFVVYGFTEGWTINAMVNFTLMGLTAKLTDGDSAPLAWRNRRADA